jgi:imidazolonepropionase-like amidohydrolase
MLTRSLAAPIATFEPGIGNTPPAVARNLERLGVTPAQAAGAASYFAAALKVTGALHRLGVPIITGTDMIVPGYSLDRSIELLVQSGFTPMDAIRAATSLPARAMGRAATVGTIEPGRAADLVVLDRDPLADIHNIRSVRYVVKDGVVFDPRQLHELAGFAP